MIYKVERPLVQIERGIIYVLPAPTVSQNNDCPVHDRRSVLIFAGVSYM